VSEVHDHKGQFFKNEVAEVLGCDIPEISDGYPNISMFRSSINIDHHLRSRVFSGPRVLRIAFFWMMEMRLGLHTESTSWDVFVSSAPASHGIMVSGIM